MAGYKVYKGKTKLDKMEEKDRPISMLVWGDSPASSTGFATLVRNIFTPLAKSGKYDIDIIGINDRGGWKDPEEFPFRIYPARQSNEIEGDFHGRPRLIAGLSGRDTDLKPPWDIVFTVNDPFVLEEPVPVFNKGTLEVIKDIQKLYKKKLPPHSHFKVISYWPIDSLVRGNWVEKAIALPDVSVGYTEYAKREIKKGDMEAAQPTGVADEMRVIYHGVNTSEFKPMPQKDVDEFRQTYFQGKISADTFLVSVVARNQMRKDIPRTMQIFREFQKRRPDSFLYIHAQENDSWGPLKEYARNYNLELGKDWGFPSNFTANKGFPVEAINMLYNASDCIISTSLGEGFGFYNFEAMATKTSLLAPNNTVHPELFNYDAKEDISDIEELYKTVRGIPLKAGSTTSEWATYGPVDLMRPRPLVNVDDAVKKLVWLYDNPDKGKEITERAYEWVQQYDWEKIVKVWDNLFQEVFQELTDERKESAKHQPSQATSASQESEPTERGESSKT